MDFSIDPAVSQKYAGLTIGFIEGACSANAFTDESAFLAARQEAMEAARAIPVLAEHPHLAAWRKVFKSFGADPTKTRSSGEALIRRLQKGDELPRINAIVDCYNVSSAKHACPVGGQDAAQVAGGVVLRLAAADETFVPLGASEPHGVDAGEVVYADSEKILCSKWNYRDCEPAKIADSTTKFVLFVDGAPGVPAEKVEAAAKELCELIQMTVSGASAAYRIVRG